MKKLFTFLLIIGFCVPVIVSATLWNYYQEQGLNLPSVEDRTAEATYCGIQDYQGLYEQNITLEGCFRGNSEEVFGGNLPIAGSTYNLAGSGITGSATSITLKKLELVQTGQKLQDSDFSDTFYITLEPGNIKRQEISACTTVTQNGDGSATLSGCSRGMSPITPYTASTTLQFSHSGGSQVIFSDPPQLFREYSSKDNIETITNVWTFNRYPEFMNGTDSPSSTNQLTPKFYVDNVVNQGASTSTESVAGISELATQVEMASSTPWSADEPHIIQSKYASSTPSASITGNGEDHYVVVTEDDGKINQNWFDLTEPWTFTGLFSITGTNTISGNTTSTGNLEITGNATSTGAFDFTGEPRINNRDISSGFERWQPNSINLLVKSSLATTTFSAGDMDSNSAIKLFAFGSQSWSAGVNAYLSLEFGGFEIASTTIYSNLAGTTGKTHNWTINCLIINTDTNAQRTGCTWNYSADGGYPFPTATTTNMITGVDTTAQQELILYATQESNLNSSFVSGGLIELIK